EHVPNVLSLRRPRRYLGPRTLPHAIQVAFNEASHPELCTPELVSVSRGHHQASSASAPSPTRASSRAFTAARCCSTSSRRCSARDRFIRFRTTADVGSSTPAATYLVISSAVAARVGGEAGCQSTDTRESYPAGTSPSRTSSARRPTTTHERPKPDWRRSVRFTSRDSPIRIASALDGLDVWMPR